MKILVLEPHNRCNCRCVMCDIWRRTVEREIGQAELERHLEDIVSLGVEQVVFTGGEPLMHSDLFRLAAPLRARGLRITLLSSGLLLRRDAERIVASMDDVIVSLDGPREVHDGIRRVPGAYERLADGVRALHWRSREFPVSARCTVQAQNGHICERPSRPRDRWDCDPSPSWPPIWIPARSIGLKCGPRVERPRLRLSYPRWNERSSA